MENGSVDEASPVHVSERKGFESFQNVFDSSAEFGRRLPNALWTHRYLMAVTVIGLASLFAFVRLQSCAEVERFTFPASNVSSDEISSGDRVREPQLKENATEARLQEYSDVALVKSAPGVGLCDEQCRPVLKVYLYDLPEKFNFGMFEPSDSVSDQKNLLELNMTHLFSVPYGPGSVKHQHSMAYYLTADLLLKNEDLRNRTISVRVTDPLEADVFFVPFFATLSYNKYNRHESEGKDIDRELQLELLQVLNGSSWWHRSGGRDHIFCITHPNALRHIRDGLGESLFILSDFDRLSKDVGRLSKDVVAPYKHLTPSYSEDSLESGVDPFRNRTLLLFFQGTVKRKKAGRIRRKMQDLLKNEADVFFEDIRPVEETLQTAAVGMRSSKFCLHPAGDTASSCRLFDALASHCVPVIVSDFLDLPFEDDIDYKAFSIFVSVEDALTEGHLVNLLRSVERERWLAMWHNIQKVEHHFRFNMPALRGDAVDMVWDQVHKKLPRMRLAMRRSERLVVPEWWHLRRRRL